MFSRVLALLAVLLLSANTWAAIEINNHQARNMDDVQSLGVIYINLTFHSPSPKTFSPVESITRCAISPRVGVLKLILTDFARLLTQL
ncbi:hypothetical protein ECO25NV_42100 [Escherichia coli O25:H4]|nr:hypothetical protein ECO25NV_42100 [Escherichia coli O25:H4]